MTTESITGRDGYIVCKALAYAIATIQALPERRREYSDMRDMITLMNAYVPHPKERLFYAQGVAAHTGRAPDLMPEVEELSQA